MKILIAGLGGMLAKALGEEAKAMGHRPITMSSFQMPIHEARAVSVALNEFAPIGAVINAAGVIPLATAGVGTGERNVRMVLANALGPQVLANACIERRVPLIHVSTDCVFAGGGPNAIHGLADLPDAADVYGRSKMVGEMILEGPHEPELITVVRTSFIGWEHGLLPWLVAHEGGEVTGYTRAWWSGSSVYAVARGLITMAVAPPGGLRHLASEPTISKHRLLVMLAAELGLEVTITPSDEPFIGRGLLATDPLPPLEDAISELVTRRP